MSDEQTLPVEEQGGPGEDDLTSAYAEAFGDDQPAGKPLEEPENIPPSDEVGTDESGDGDGEPEEDDEQLKKRAHSYDSAMGRVVKEQDVLRRKAAEYERVKETLKQTLEEQKKIEAAMEEARRRQQELGQRPPQPMGQQALPQSGPLPMAEIPDDIKEEAASFTRDYPELAPLLHFPGKEGQKLRKLLADYGPDVASIHGNAVMANYRLAQAQEQFQGQLTQSEQRVLQQQQEMQARLENERKQSHYERIYTSVPDYAALATDPSRRQELEQFHSALSEWAESKPHRDYAQISQILKQGDADSVVHVLRQFQSEQQFSGVQQPAHSGRQAAARAAQAIPSRSSGPPRGRPDPNDIHSAFREAFGS